MTSIFTLTTTMTMGCTPAQVDFRLA